jgi:predicted ATPase with chaperone activity
MFFEKEEKKVETYNLPKKPSHFDIYGKLVKKEQILDIEKQYFNGFMFINQLSMRKNTLPISVMLNSSKAYDEHLFEIAKILAPKVKFIKFIKKQKNENLDDIMWYFKVNFETAKRYKKQLTKEELKYIKDFYNEFKTAN